MNKKAMPIGKFKANILALLFFALGFVSLIYPIGESAGFNQKAQIAGNVSAKTVPAQANDPRLQAQPVSWCPPGYCGPILIGGKWVCVPC